MSERELIPIADHREWIGYAVDAVMQQWLSAFNMWEITGD